MQYIFTNYQLLIVGFGLSDPDFDSLLQNVFSTFGSPIQEHIVIKHIKDKTQIDTIYRLRYGLKFLYVDNFDDIQTIIRDCIRYPGEIIKNILEKCTSSDLSTRNESHGMIQTLSNVGKQCLATTLEETIKENISKENNDNYNLNTETSEYVYTYGIIAIATKLTKHKKFLIEQVVEKSNYSEPVAHALFNLSDLELVKKWLIIFQNKTFKEDLNNLDPYNRVYKYTESIYYYLCAKYGVE